MVAERGGFVDNQISGETKSDQTLPLAPFLRRLSFYCDVSNAMVDAIHQASGRLRHHDPGKAIIEIGEPLERAFIVSSGWAIRFRTLEDGRRQILNVLVPGDLFDLQVLVGGEADHGVQTITELSVYEMDRDGLQQMLHGTDRLATALWWTMVQEEAFLREQIIRNGRQSARERIGHFLLEMHRRIGIVQEAQEDGVRQPLTQTHIADALGLTPIHTNRILRQLQREELIQRERGYVRFLQADLLAEICHFEPAYFHIENFSRRLDGALFV